VKRCLQLVDLADLFAAVTDVSDGEVWDRECCGSEGGTDCALA
jgi:hypothetical protein